MGCGPVSWGLGGHGLLPQSTYSPLFLPTEASVLSASCSISSLCPSRPTSLFLTLSPGRLTFMENIKSSGWVWLLGTPAGDQRETGACGCGIDSPGFLSVGWLCLSLGGLDSFKRLTPHSSGFGFPALPLQALGWCSGQNGGRQKTSTSSSLD